MAIALNRKRPAQRWLVASLALVLAGIIVTQLVNVPLNDGLTAAGDPNTIDVARVRLEFNEARWRTWNHVRSATTPGAFLCLTGALFRQDPRIERRDDVPD